MNNEPNKLEAIKPVLCKFTTFVIEYINFALSFHILITFLLKEIKLTT